MKKGREPREGDHEATRNYGERKGLGVWSLRKNVARHKLPKITHTPPPPPVSKDRDNIEIQKEVSK